ncbi:MAG: hypothetical protein WBW37_01995, partial [Methyloceanibacter sp.]
DKAAAEKAAAATPQVPASTAPGAEANSGAPRAVPSARQEPEQLPWSQTPVGADQASQPATPAADAQTTPAAAADDALPAPAPATPRKKPGRPPPARDDWKRGISIFGGG